MAKKKTPPKSHLPANRRTGLPAGYAELLDGLKARIRSTQLKAATAVHRELVTLYWHVGRPALHLGRTSEGICYSARYSNADQTQTRSYARI